MCNFFTFGFGWITNFKEKPVFQSMCESLCVATATSRENLLNFIHICRWVINQCSFYNGAYCSMHFTVIIAFFSFIIFVKIISRYLLFLCKTHIKRKSIYSALKCIVRTYWVYWSLMSAWHGGPLGLAIKIWGDNEISQNSKFAC